jgi:AraC-like DNA-binding protein
MPSQTVVRTSCYWHENAEHSKHHRPDRLLENVGASGSNGQAAGSAFWVIARSGEELATEEQRDYSATIKSLQGMIKMSSAAEFENATSGNRAEPVAIWKARKFIEEHSGEELSLSRVAKAVNMNANYLSENFKQVTGIKFVEYVARTRFEKACRLLHDGDLRIIDIAFTAGFQSVSQFNRVFKRFAGKSPTQLRTAKPVVCRHR